MHTVTNGVLQARSITALTLSCKTGEGNYSVLRWLERGVDFFDWPSPNPRKRLNGGFEAFLKFFLPPFRRLTLLLPLDTSGGKKRVFYVLQISLCLTFLSIDCYHLLSGAQRLFLPSVARLPLVTQRRN